MSFNLKYVVYAGIAVLAFVIFVYVTASKRPPTETDGRQAVEMSSEWKDALGLVMEFRKVAVGDYDKAASSLCNSKAQLLFEQINESIWTICKPDIGWSWFLDSSLFTVTGVDTGHPLAAYYNPWCDCFLLLGMEGTGGKLVIADVEVLPADCIRKSGKPPFDFNSRWNGDKAFPPEVIATTFVASISAFENLFPNGAEKDWRNRCVPQLPGIWMRIIHPAASLACGNAILTVSEFRARPDPGLPMMNALQPAVMDAIRQCDKKGLAEFAAETRATQKVCLDAVRILGDETFKGLKVAYAITGEITAFAFCINPKSPGMCVAFSCRLANSKMEVVRVDLIHFPAVYQSTTK